MVTDTHVHEVNPHMQILKVAGQLQTQVELKIILPLDLKRYFSKVYASSSDLQPLCCKRYTGMQQEFGFILNLLEWYLVNRIM